MASKVPPVFSTELACPKCGFVDEVNYPQVMWCSGDECDHKDRSNVSGDHLHSTCNLCGYEHLVRPKDHAK